MFEQLDGFQQQVVEVERVRVAERSQVHTVERADLLIARLKSAAQSITFTAGAYTFSAGVKGFDSPNGIYSVALGESPYELDSVAANFGGTNVVGFDGYGKPASGGTVVLALQGHQCTLTVNGTTGDVSITSVHALGNAPRYGN
jgi:hypothetical protein